MKQEMKIFPLQISDLSEVERLMSDIGVSEEGRKIMAPKAVFRAFKIKNVSAKAANIIKQEMLSLGAEAAVDRKILFNEKETDIIIVGTLSQLRRLVEKLKLQPFGLKEIALELEVTLKNLSKKEYTFFARGRELKITKPIICGIINLTPDSFSKDGLLAGINERKASFIHKEITNLVMKKVGEMVENGAKIIDLGGESTRPYAKPIDEEEEIKRVIPYLKVIRKEFPDLFLSIDTYKYRIAKEAVNEGVDIINDITALRKSPLILSLIKKYKLGCVLMHMKGEPQTMQMSSYYQNDVVEEILQFLRARVEVCLKEGVDTRQIMIDPGIGFGKTVENNLEILNRLAQFKSLGLPIFLGISRKSFIGKILNLEVEERLIGTIASLVISVVKGANVLRVHDVKEAYQALRMADRILNN
ncbi:MAG: dihydropteroate synthase [Candidatus Omnitrophica bacterium 4484_70.2]|nr:MAG: dihydropteroate synthase [Candidatus Omnitrophica bacterium 4484_70.2]